MMRGLSRLTILALAVIPLLAGCGSERPSAEEWQQTWQRMALAVPSEEALGDSPSPDDCGDVVAFLRSNDDFLRVRLTENVCVGDRLDIHGAAGGGG